MTEVEEYQENFGRLKDELEREFKLIKAKDPSSHKKVS